MDPLGLFKEEGKSTPASEAATEADVSKQVQRFKELTHGIVPQQLRLLRLREMVFFKE